jgi:hypothetical protein
MKIQFPPTIRAIPIRRRKLRGDQSWEEMMVGFLDVAARAGDG